MNSSISKLLYLAFVLPSLSGCVMYEEHVTLDEKGGAVVDIHINTQTLSQISPEAADPVVLKMLLARSRPPDVALSVEKNAEDIHVTLNAQKTTDLLEWARKEQNPLGVANVQFSDGYMEVTRTILPINEFDLKSLDRAPGVKMVFKLTGPGKLISSTATRSEGNTAVWEIDPRELDSKTPTVFKATFRVSTPWLTYILVALTAVCIGAFFVVLRRKGSA